jgi:hypothetical protein
MHRVASPIALSLFVFLYATSAEAQPRPERPYRGLFGGGAPVDLAQGLGVTFAIGGGWNDNVAPRRHAGGRPSDFNRTVRGITSQASAVVTYTLNRDRVNVNASAGTQGRHYPSLQPSLFRQDYVHSRVSMRLLGALAAYGTATYSPYDLDRLLVRSSGAGAEDPDPGLPDMDLASSGDHYFAYGGGLALGLNRGLQVSRRGSLTGSYRIHQRASSLPQDASDGLVSPRGGFRGQSAGGTYNYQLSQGLSLRAGYRFQQAWYNGGQQRPVRHVINVGANFTRNLSFSRRTSVAFNTGTVAAGDADLDGRTRVRAIGSAMLVHELGRTWNARLTYLRDLTFSEVWPEPVVHDSLALGIDGLISRRLQFNAAARASDGRSGLGRSAGGFNWGVASAGIGFALSRHASLGARYSYYVHRFDEAVRLAPGVPPVVDRHSAGVYLTIWAPLVQQARTGDASR